MSRPASVPRRRCSRRLCIMTAAGCAWSLARGSTGSPRGRPASSTPTPARAPAFWAGAGSKARPGLTRSAAAPAAACRLGSMGRRVAMGSGPPMRDERRREGRAVSPSMDEAAVRSAYRRWAPVYDTTFGVVAAEGRKHAVEIINTRSGRVLEVGVGTGLSLPAYNRSLEIVGIDLSPEMLRKARERVATEGLTNVTGLHEMDAGDLKFPDAAF